MGKICTRCGKMMPENVQFCSNCGESFQMSNGVQQNVPHQISFDGEQQNTNCQNSYNGGQQNTNYQDTYNVNQQQNNNSPQKTGKIDTRTTGIIAYITLIGFLVGYFKGDREGAKFHLNQGLVLNGISIITIILIMPQLAFIFDWAGDADYYDFDYDSMMFAALNTMMIPRLVFIFVFICFCIGLYGAIKGEEREMPLLGKIKILK